MILFVCVLKMILLDCVFKIDIVCLLVENDIVCVFENDFVCLLVSLKMILFKCLCVGKSFCLCA